MLRGIIFLANGSIPGQVLPPSYVNCPRDRNSDEAAVSRAYAIFIDTLLEGCVPSVRDEHDKPCLFATRTMAEREVADNIITRLQEFMDGQRDFEDAVTLEEYVVEVEVLPDGSIMVPSSESFGIRS